MSPTPHMVIWWKSVAINYSSENRVARAASREVCRVSGSSAGDHILLWLRDYPFNRTSELSRRAEAVEVRIYSVRPFYLSPPKRAGLLLGYASLTKRAISEGIRQLATVLD